MISNSDEWLQKFLANPGAGCWPPFVRDEKKAEEAIDKILAILKAMGPQPEPVVERDLSNYEWFDYRSPPIVHRSTTDYAAHSRMLCAIKGIL